MNVTFHHNEKGESESDTGSICPLSADHSGQIVTLTF